MDETPDGGHRLRKLTGGGKRRKAEQTEAVETSPRPKAPEQGSDDDSLWLPLAVMLAIAALVGGMAYWKLALTPNHDDVVLPAAVAVGDRPAAPEAPPTDTEEIVVVKDMKFSPSSVTVKVGDSVTWQFEDGGKLHAVSGLGDFAMIINSGYLKSGVYTVTFDRPGVYRYVDGVHGEMTGSITVE